jgi:hypothetical protein
LVKQQITVGKVAKGLSTKPCKRLHISGSKEPLQFVLVTEQHPAHAKQNSLETAKHKEPTARSATHLYSSLSFSTTIELYRSEETSCPFYELS